MSLIYSLMAVAVISYVLMQSIETISFGSRVAGRIVSRHALGTTLQQTLFTGSRLFLVSLLPTLAYLVETGIDVRLYLMLVTASLLLAFVISIVVFFRLNNFQHFFQNIFFLYDGHNILVAIVNAILIKRDKGSVSLVPMPHFSKNYLSSKTTIVSFAAYTFLATGFFVTFLLACIFSEYRLTLSQMSAVFHGIGAVLVSFYLDPMLSRSIDKIQDNDSWLKNVYSILLGRIVSYLFGFTMFMIVLIYFLFLS